MVSAKACSTSTVSFASTLGAAAQLISFNLIEQVERPSSLEPPTVNMSAQP